MSLTSIDTSILTANYTYETIHYCNYFSDFSPQLIPIVPLPEKSEKFSGFHPGLPAISLIPQCGKPTVIHNYSYI